MSAATGGMLKGRLSCMWSLYRSDGSAGGHESVSSVPVGSAHHNLTLVGEADTGEAFVERLLCQLKEFSGSLHIFRKHVAPCWDALSSGGHFRVEQSISQVETEAQMALFGKLEFICDVVAEKLAKSSMIAGVGLSVASGIMILSLWVVGTDSGIVEHLRNEILTRTMNSATRTTIRFIHHNTIPSERVSKVDPKALGLTLMMSHLAIPGISINDLPSADEIGYTPPGAVSMRRRSFRDEDASPSLQQDASFSESCPLSNPHASLLRHSSSLSAFDHHRTSLESGANTMLPAPTPIADWTTSWTPSMFLAAHRRSSTSSEGTTGREGSSTPKGGHAHQSGGGFTPSGATASGAAGGGGFHAQHVGTPPQPVLSSVGQQGTSSGSGPLPSYAAPQQHLAHVSSPFQAPQQPTTIYIQPYAAANNGYGSHGDRNVSVAVRHQHEGGYAAAQYPGSNATTRMGPPAPLPVAGQQPLPQQYQQQPYANHQQSQHLFGHQLPFATSTSPTVQDQQSHSGGTGAQLHMQSFPFAQYQVTAVATHANNSTANLGYQQHNNSVTPPPLTRFAAIHQPYPTVAGPPAPNPTGSGYRVEGYTFAAPQLQSSQQQQPPPPQYSVYSGQQRQHSGAPPQNTLVSPMPPQTFSASSQHVDHRQPHHPTTGYQQQQHHPQHHSRHAPPQSDRKAFVFRGLVYPAGLNRKEYRQIVHHSDDAQTQPGKPPSFTSDSTSHIETFPAPQGYADCDIDPGTYDTLKTEYLLMRVRM